MTRRKISTFGVDAGLLVSVLVHVFKHVHACVYVCVMCACIQVWSSNACMSVMCVYSMENSEENVKYECQMSSSITSCSFEARTLLKPGACPFIYFIICVWVFVRVSHVSDSCGGQKRASSPLKLKLQMVGSHHVDAGNLFQVLLTTEPSLQPPRAQFT